MSSEGCAFKKQKQKNKLVEPQKLAYSQEALLLKPAVLLLSSALTTFLWWWILILLVRYRNWANSHQPVVFTVMRIGELVHFIFCVSHRLLRGFSSQLQLIKPAGWSCPSILHSLQASPEEQEDGGVTGGGGRRGGDFCIAIAEDESAKEGRGVKQMKRAESAGGRGGEREKERGGEGESGRGGEGAHSGEKMRIILPSSREEQRPGETDPTKRSPWCRGSKERKSLQSLVAAQLKTSNVEEVEVVEFIQTKAADCRDSAGLQ